MARRHQHGELERTTKVLVLDLGHLRTLPDLSDAQPMPTTRAPEVEQMDVPTLDTGQVFVLECPSWPDSTSAHSTTLVVP